MVCVCGWGVGWGGEMAHHDGHASRANALGVRKDLVSRAPDDAVVDGSTVRGHRGPRASAHGGDDLAAPFSAAEGLGDRDCVHRVQADDARAKHRAAGGADADGTEAGADGGQPALVHAHQNGRGLGARALGGSGKNVQYGTKKTIQVLPRLELGSLDSKSKVLTITP